MEEQPEHALGEALQEEQAEGLDVPPCPDHENVLMSFRVLSCPHSGHGTVSSRFPRTISSNRSPHEWHWNS